MFDINIFMNIDFKLDLLIPEHAYIFGFIQADGHMSKDSRNKGRISISLKESDNDILFKMSEIIPFYSSIKK